MATKSHNNEYDDLHFEVIIKEEEEELNEEEDIFKEDMNNKENDLFYYGLFKNIYKDIMIREVEEDEPRKEERIFHGNTFERNYTNEEYESCNKSLRSEEQGGLYSECVIKQIKKEQYNDLLPTIQIPKKNIVIKKEVEIHSCTNNENNFTEDRELVKPETKTQLRKKSIKSENVTGEYATHSDEETIPYTDSLYIEKEVAKTSDIYKNKLIMDFDVDSKVSDETLFNKEQDIVNSKQKLKLNVFKCDNCDRYFDSKLNLEIHYRIHLVEKPFKCEICNKRYKSVEILKMHHNVHVKPFKCYKCGKCFAQKDALNIHDRTHTGETPFKCYKCGKGFKSKGHLKTHEKVHDNSIKYNKSYIKKEPLNINQKDSRTCENSFNCEKCGKSFKSIGNLKKHESIHVLDKSLEGNKCENKFKQKETLDIHNRIRADETPYKCGMSFTSKGHLKIHKKIHDKSIICNESPVKNKSLNHLKMSHNNKPFKCNTCDKCFAQKDALQIHNRIHTGENPFICGKCGKSFRSKGNLKMHEIIHMSEKPFKCNKCDKSFAQKEALNVHNRLHTGETPHKCNKCGKSYRSQSSLLLHIRIHNKPFKCNVCDKSFSQKNSWINHERTHVN